MSTPRFRLRRRALLAYLRGKRRATRLGTRFVAHALRAEQVILGEFGVLAFSPIVISSVTATVLSRHFLGDFPAFQVPVFELSRPAEFLPYTALGILAGLLSVAFIASVYRSQDLFGQHDVEEIAVVAPGSERTLLGSVRRKHVIDAYNREIFQLDLAGGFHSVATAAERDHGVELLGGYRLVEVGVPYAFVGRTLRDIGARARYGVEIILIRKPPQDGGDIPARPGAFPHPSYRLCAGDTLLVMGAREDIRRFQDALPAAAAGEPAGGPGPVAGGPGV